MKKRSTTVDYCEVDFSTKIVFQLIYIPMDMLCGQYELVWISALKSTKNNMKLAYICQVYVNCHSQQRASYCEVTLQVAGGYRAFYKISPTSHSLTCSFIQHTCIHTHILSHRYKLQKWYRFNIQLKKQRKGIYAAPNYNQLCTLPDLEHSRCLSS